MIHNLLRFGTGVAFLMILLSPMSAQEKQPPKEKVPPGGDAAAKDLEDYRQFFKKPETVEEYWKAMQFEIDVGQYGLAAQMLRGLIAKQPSDDELVQLEAKYGMAAFLKLRTLPPFLDRDQKVPRWSENPKVQQQALDDIEDLIKRITAAVKKKLADRERIVKYVQALTASPEEAAFALKQLVPYRAQAVPPLIDELRTAKDEDRLALRNALRRLPPDVIAPLTAALDSHDPLLILDVLSVFVQRGAKETVPYLWYVSASPTYPASVRTKATEALEYFLDAPASKLSPAKMALTREAERYYQHQVAFVDPKAVVICRWEKNGIVQGWPGAETVPATKAEEYYGLRFARQALDLDPAYRPAQETRLSIILDKTLENADLSQPLAKISPSVHELLTTTSSDVLLAVLERALTDQRSTVVLACVRALGERVETKASKPTGHAEPALVRALDYGDKRVQMAAAESLLRMPTPPSSSYAKKRIVEILRGNLAVVNSVSLESKVIVASSDADLRRRMGQAVLVSNFEPVPLSSGREVLRRLSAANDISAIIIDSTLPDPGLASFLAQVRADVNASRLPLLILAVPDNAESRETVEKYKTDRAQLDVLISRTRPYRARRQELDVKYEQTVAKIRQSSMLGQVATRDSQIAVATAQYRDELGVLAKSYPDGAIMDKEAQTVEKRLRELEDKYSAQCQRREEALKRWLEKSPTVSVGPLGALDDPKKLRYRLLGEEGKTETKPLTEAEHKEYAEKSIQYFGSMARGEIAGYDMKWFYDLDGLPRTVYDALRSAKLSEPGQAAAIDVVVHLSAPRSQTELSDVILDAKRPLALRIKATDALVGHIQQNSLLLAGDLVARLRKLYEETAQGPEEKDFKAKLAVLYGRLPSARSTGERLRDYQPPVPAAPRGNP